MSLLDAGFQLVGNWLNNEAAEDRQNAAQGWSAEQYAKRYQTQVKDLEAAGLNPMLAYAQSPGASPTGQAAPTTSLASGVMSAYRQAEMNSAQVANIEADTSNKNASADLIAGQAAFAWASADKALAETEFVKRQADKVVQDVRKSMADEDYVRELIKNQPLVREKLSLEIQKLPHEMNQVVAMALSLAAHADLDREKAQTEQMTRLQLRAIISKVDAETDLLKLDKAAADKFENIGREAGQLKPVFDVLAAFIRARGK